MGKLCADCGAIKPLEAFHTRSELADGRQTYCRDCARQRYQFRRDGCRPCHNARGRASLDRNRGARKYHLRRRYAIDAAEWQAMLERQRGMCAICREAPAEHDDHDHVTGVVRGMLCFNCDGGLGQFRDDPVRLQQAIDYLRGSA